jgi:hypothetical protein
MFDVIVLLCPIVLFYKLSTKKINFKGQNLIFGIFA